MYVTNGAGALAPQSVGKHKPTYVVNVACIEFFLFGGMAGSFVAPLPTNIWAGVDAHLLLIVNDRALIFLKKTLVMEYFEVLLVFVNIGNPVTIVFVLTGSVYRVE